MTGFIFNRLLQGAIVLLGASALVFVLVRMTGNPATLLLPADASQEDYARLTAQLGLDRPLYEQYGVFLGDMARGNFGSSIRLRRPVAELIGPGLANSMQLGGLSFVFALALGIPLGILAAVKRGTPIDFLARTLALLGQSVPSFWLGIVMIAVFAGWLQVLPAAGAGTPAHYVLPVITLTVTGFLLSGTVRFLRSGMLEVLDSDYIKLARAKGLAERVVIWKHAFRNAVIPLVTFLGFYLTLLVGGASLVVETVFAWPGVGSLLNQAILARDFPVVQAVVIIFVAGFVVSNLLVDLLYAYLDPRIRYH